MLHLPFFVFFFRIPGVMESEMESKGAARQEAA